MIEPLLFAKYYWNCNLYVILVYFEMLICYLQIKTLNYPNEQSINYSVVFIYISLAWVINSYVNRDKPNVDELWNLNPCVNKIHVKVWHRQTLLVIWKQAPKDRNWSTLVLQRPVLKWNDRKMYKQSEKMAIWLKWGQHSNILQ